MHHNIFHYDDRCWYEMCVTAQGPMGLKGDRGNVGPPGAWGAPGPKGDMGETGVSGLEVKILLFAVLCFFCDNNV